MNRVRLAARCNAHLHERICNAHGCVTETNDSYLLCLGTPPRFYATAVTLQTDGFKLLAGEISGTFKDSFGDAEPDPARYRVLFAAEWIWKNASSTPQPSLNWAKIETDEALRRWEDEWSRGDSEAANFPRQFPASLLGCSDVSFYAAWKNGEIVAGVLFNDSPPVVGVSNAFGAGLGSDRLWAELVSLAHSRFPSLHLTGYEAGDSLTAASRAGCEVVGPLRVWVPVS